MKYRALLLVFLVSSPFAMATNVEIGDDLDTTLGKLGKPVGTIVLKQKTLLLYSEGDVTLQNDAVVEIDLMSDAEFEAEQKRQQREREEWLVQKAKMEEAHKEEGLSIRAAKRGSSAFASLTAKDKVDYWRSFQIRYPSVDVSEDLAGALESYETELAELKSRQRIAQLEARVARAEQKAANARFETQRLKKETERDRRSTRHGLRYYYDPVVQPRYDCRPRTLTIISNDSKKQIKHERPNHWNFRHYDRGGTAERVARILHGRRGD